MGKLKQYTLAMSCLFVILSSCSEKGISGVGFCGDYAIEDESRYVSTVSTNYTIKDVVAAGNCITITISASGCSGDRWRGTLYFSEQIVETTPNQRSSKLSLVTNEACLAVIEKSFTFNIGNMRPENEPFMLKLEGLNYPIVIN
ncbi:hypothetical protein RQM59_02905 [Flavobacteriaceae bacterium S356]|uniref:Lipoprotein n=1 Tax=Asprobacillus argus TaxID=3076534 RepID=A0ABU3LC47_9FLAO|nr:hypothetical protein [Flavobacteriaceae bacterium S356]